MNGAFGMWATEEKLIPQTIKIRMQNGKGLFGFKGNRYKKKFIHILKQQ